MTKQLKLIAFNGPPGSGKDYATDEAAHVVEEHHQWIAIPHKMSAPLKRMIPAIFNKTWRELEGEKDKALLPVFGSTFRQAQIDASEKYLKKLYGREVFGRLAINEILTEYKRKLYDNYNVCIIISDLGFDYELKYLIDWVGAENCRVVQVYRDGYDFIGDSRSYVTIPGVVHTGLHNDGTKKFDGVVSNFVRGLLK